MTKEIKTYNQAIQALRLAVNTFSAEPEQAKEIKEIVQNSYGCLGQMLYNRAFLNWGLRDRNIEQEYKAQNFTFSLLCPYQDINAQLLLYFLIRPLFKTKFFNKRLLEIGCGNGIGLKMTAQLLQTKYALGVDLVQTLVSNAQRNFYAKEHVNYLQADAELLPLQDESFDIITNLESSHLYPRVDHFFSEVVRILTPGGFFCYADVYTDAKKQAMQLDQFVASRKNLCILQKKNITKMVQASIYNRLIANEKKFYNMARSIFGDENPFFLNELSYLARAMGISFLPWWKVWMRNPDLRPIAKAARKSEYWGGTKLYYYYLIQKR